MKKIAMFVWMFTSLAMVTPYAGQAATAAAVSAPYWYTFNSAGVLHESGSTDSSWSRYWWLNSGGVMPIAGNVGMTNQGELASYNPWRVLYAANNPTDTDNGYHPQNIFRLVTRSTWDNVSQEAYFRIEKDNLSSSSNRNASNGLLLMQRYNDGNNLYYAGVRVDGAAVIKKKKDGRYYTLAYEKIFPGSYNRSSNPNLIPHDTWIGVRVETEDRADGSTVIRLFTDVGETGNWTLALETVDNGSSYGGAALGKGYGGIRTDFMDVSFKGFKIENL